MSKKRTWKAHSLDLIKAQDKCAGDVPPTGGMDDLLSDQEFLAMARAAGIHPWNSCHYVDEVLGLAPTDAMVDLGAVGDRKKMLEAVEGLTGVVNEVSRSKRLVEFKTKMKNYIDRIEFEGDRLNVPGPLLRFSQFVNRFFA